MTFIPQDPNIKKSCLNACTKEAIEAGVCNCLNKVNIKQFDIPVVSDSCEWCGIEKENRNGLCRECGRFPSPGNYR